MTGRSILLALLLAAAPLARAQPADPLKSPECGSALAQLQAARSGGQGDVESVRRQAAAACLGGLAAPSRPARVVQAPIRVPPPMIEAPARRPLPAIPAPPPAPVATEHAPTISSCDPAGCWVTQGNRLQHVTPNLMGPAGLCGVAPGAAGCP